MPTKKSVPLLDANNQRVTFLFDALGQDRGSIDPLNRRVSFAYDPDGRRTLKLDPRGNRLTYLYDALARQTNILYAARRSTFAYDAASNRTLMADNTGTYTTAYDAKNRTIRTVNAAGKTVTYTYDLADRRRTLTDSDGGRFTYTHDAKGRLILLSNPQSDRTTTTFDVLDHPVQQVMANGAATTQIYDAAGQLTGIVTGGAGGLLSRFTYTYDNAGRRIQALIADGSRATYGYDPAGQLLREQRNGSNAANATFSYDPAGNRTLLLDSGQPTSYTYDQANQLIVALGPSGPTTYQYDPCGNRTQTTAPAANTYYSWDEDNQLIQAEPVAGPVTLSYNADHYRVRKISGGSTTNYLYDFEKVLQESDDTGTTTREYTSTDGQYGSLLSEYGGGAALYHAYDALGSTDKLLAADGSVSNSYAYRAFGLETATPPDGTDYSFVGRDGYINDRDIELYFLRRRYYDPDTGRFLNEDPAGYPAGVNLFLYVHNDPINAIDPSGLWSWRDFWTPVQQFGERVGEVAVQGIKYTTKAISSAVNLVVGETVTFAQGLKLQVTCIAGSIVSGWATIGSLFYYKLTEAAFCLIDAALTTANINPDDFWSALNTVGGQLQKLASKAGELIGNFLTGAKQGVENFGSNLPDHFIDGLARWLGIPALPKIFKQITMPDLSKVPEIVLELLGYTWDNLLALVQKAIQPLDLAIVTKLFSEVAKALNLGLEGYVSEKIAELRKQITDFVSNLTPTLVSALQQILTTMLVQVAEKVAIALAEKLISLLSPVGWLGQLAKGIYDGIRFIIRNFGKIADLFTKLKAVYNAVIQGIDVQTIANRVESALAGSVVPALDAIATAAGLSAIPDAIKSALKKIQSVALKPVTVFLQAVGSLIKKVFAALLAKLKFSDKKKPLLDPVDVDAKGQHKLFVTSDGKVWLTGQGKDQDVVSCLTKAQKSATGKQQTMIGGALTQASQLSKDVKTVASNAQKTQTSATVKQTASATQKATQEEKGLAKLLAQLSCACGLPGKGSCVIAETRVRDEDDNWWPAKDIPLLGGVLGFTATDGLGWPRRLPSAVVAEHYREYRLLMEEDRADVVEAELIRPAGWLECLQGRENGQVYLDLGEVGVRGWAWVLGVHPCPERRGSGRGCLVTGKFKHSRGRVVELRIEGESQVLGITPSHLVWCVDRADWVMAGELLPGERMLAADGSTPVVEAVSLREQPETVYNIEVEGDHCYRVGEQGLLVHNASPGQQPGEEELCGPPYPCDMPLRIQELSNREFNVVRCEDRDTLYNMRFTGTTAFRRACEACNPGISGMSVLSVAPSDEGETCYENMAVRRTHPYVPASPVLHITCGKSKRERSNVSVFCCPCCEYKDGRPMVVWYCYCAKIAGR